MEHTYHSHAGSGNSMREVRIQAKWWSAVGEAPNFRGRLVSGYVDEDRRLWVDLRECASALGDQMIARAVRSTIAILESESNRAEDFGIAYGTGRIPLLSMLATKCLDGCATSSVGAGSGHLFWQYAAQLERKARRYRPLRDWDELPDALDRTWRDAIADTWRKSPFDEGFA